jgi:steroid delta-isomerase-like uncharacterized protein
MAITVGVERILQEWADAWSAHEPDRLLALFTPEVLYEDVTFGVAVRGSEQLRTFATNVFAAVPDLRIELDRHFGNGSMAAMEWVMSGTHRGDFPGLPGTGKRFSFRGVTVVELAGGRIQRNSDYWDAATLMRQVGLLPSA